eukprot:s1072_g15.t1
MKFLRFIELHLDEMENQMKQARPKSKSKAKAAPRAPRASDHPEMPHEHDPWNPSSDEEITTWEPVTNTEEMGHMQERLSEMEGVLQQILSHLNQPGTRPPMA